MEIVISNSTSKPIYEQITSQIKEMIMNGELKTGDPIPSMRSLARTIIETTVGRGSFVAARNKEFIQEEQRKKIEEHLLIAAETARVNGIKLEKLVELLKLFYMED